MHSTVTLYTGPSCRRAVVVQSQTRHPLMDGSQAAGSSSRILPPLESTRALSFPSSPHQLFHGSPQSYVKPHLPEPRGELDRKRSHSSADNTQQSLIPTKIASKSAPFSSKFSRKELVTMSGQKEKKGNRDKATMGPVALYCRR